MVREAHNVLPVLEVAELLNACHKCWEQCEACGFCAIKLKDDGLLDAESLGVCDCIAICMALVSLDSFSCMLAGDCSLGIGDTYLA